MALALQVLEAMKEGPKGILVSAGHMVHDPIEAADTTRQPFNRKEALILGQSWESATLKFVNW